MDKKLLNTKINYITLDQATETVEGWLKKRGKHYIVTPNPEILVDAGSDPYFLEALNSADMSIPDSSRLGWGSYIKGLSNPFLRLILAPSFIFPNILPRFDYPKTTGVDLMERLLSLSNEKGFATAYLGGSKKVADRLHKCLRTKFPGLKIVFCSGNMVVNMNGDIQFDSKRNIMIRSKDINSKNVPEETNGDIGKIPSSARLLDPRVRGDDPFNYHLLSHKIDIMFVAFGHRKQEKWMHKNIGKLNTRVMIGVGGAFDYISGEVPRAPEIMRNLGLEWFFRVIVQPWRIKRFWKLAAFVYRVIRD